MISRQGGKVQSLLFPRPQGWRQIRVRQDGVKFAKFVGSEVGLGSGLGILEDLLGTTSTN